MQILPSKNTRTGSLQLDYAAMGVLASYGAGVFADILNTKASTQATDVVLEAMTRPAPPSPLEQAAPQPLATNAMRDVKMTREDFQEVAARLEEAGVSTDTLQELDKKVSSPEGLTWGQFTQAVQESAISNHVQPVELTSEDRANLSSFFSRLGFNEQKTQELVDALANGKTGRVWAQVNAKLVGQDPSATFTISRDEMNALAKGLKLPSAAKERIDKLFAGVDGLELSASGMRKALLGVKNEVAKQFNAADGQMNQVQGILDQALAKAGQREQRDRKAGEERVAATGSKASAMLKEPQADAKAADQAKAGEQAKPGTQQPGQQGQANAAAQRDAQGRFAQQDASGNGGRGAGQRDTHADLASRVRLEADATGPTGSTDPRFAAFQGPSLAKGQDVLAGQAGRTQASQFTEQVESGILRNLGQGVRQLTLELTPDALGKLNVVLTVKGKEVQAVIKAESPEAEKMLAENLQQIRQNLEDKGLTVSKLEVRTSLSQEQAMNQQWAGAEKHNQSQERREALDRMRTNALLASGGDLARHVQSDGAKANNSQGGLDIIA